MVFLINCFFFLLHFCKLLVENNWFSFLTDWTFEHYFKPRRQDSTKIFLSNVIAYKCKNPRSVYYSLYFLVCTQCTCKQYFKIEFLLSIHTEPLFPPSVLQKQNKFFSTLTNSQTSWNFDKRKTIFFLLNLWNIKIFKKIWNFPQNIYSLK